MAQAQTQTQTKNAKQAKPAPQKRTARKPAAKSPPVDGSLPAGFQPIEGAFAESWDPEIGAELIGTWGREQTQTIKAGRGTAERRLVTVTTDEGKVWTLWCKAALTPLFDHAKEGDRVFVRYEGEKQIKKGQNPMKLFTTAIAG